MKTVENEKLLCLELERSRSNREKAVTVLNNSFLLYALFLIIGAIGFTNNYLPVPVLNLVVIFSFLVLSIGIVSYYVSTKREDDRIKSLIIEAGKKR